MHPELIYGLWCIFWAFANHKAIDEANAHILHAANGVIHFTICIYFGISIHWTIGAAMCFEGRFVFDTALNLFRRLPVGYVPENPKSIFDAAEKYLFRNNGIFPKAIYLVIAIAFNILYYKTNFL